MNARPGLVRYGKLAEINLSEDLTVVVYKARLVDVAYASDAENFAWVAKFVAATCVFNNQAVTPEEVGNLPMEWVHRIMACHEAV